MKLRRKKTPPARSQERRRQQTDWQRPAAFSYHAQRTERPDANGRQNSSLVDKRRQLLSLRYWAKRSGFLTAAVVIFACLLSIVSLATKPRIVFLDSNGGSRAFHSTETYQVSAGKYLASSFWNRNKITVDTGAASRDLQRRYPELATVSITLPFIGHRPIYYLRANAPAFVIQAVNGQYVLDSSGKALLAKDAVSGSIAENLPIIVDQTGTHVRIGKQVLSSKEARFVQIVQQTLAAREYTVQSYILPLGAAQQLDVRLVGHSYTVKFNMHDSDSARQQAGTFLATVNQLTGQRVTPAQYIDVRVPGRAYYQ